MPPVETAPTANQTPRRAGVEGRTQKRYRCKAKNVVKFAVRPSFQNFSALVHDVSANGIAFIVNLPLEPGTVLAFQLQGGLQDMSVVRTAKVMHTRRHHPVKGAPWEKKKPFFKVIFSFLGGGSPEEKKKKTDFVWLIGCRLSPPFTKAELESFGVSQE